MITHLSPTSLNLYEICGEAWRRRYRLKQYTPMTLGVWKGIAVHRAAEVNFAQKAKTRRDLPTKELIRLALDNFDQETSTKQIHFTAAERKEGEDAVRARVRGELTEVATLFAEKVAPGIQPIMIADLPAVEVELWTRRSFPDGTELSLEVRIDCISSEDGLIRIHDLKISGKQKDQITWDRDLQFTFNWAALTDKMKCEPTEIIVDQIIDYKKGPKHIPIVTTRTPEDIEVAWRHAAAQAKGVAADLFLPAPPGSWKCSPDWCDYFNQGCPYVNPERVAQEETDKKAETAKVPPDL